MAGFQRRPAPVACSGLTNTVVASLTVAALSLSAIVALTALSTKTALAIPV